MRKWSLNFIKTKRNAVVLFILLLSGCFTSYNTHGQDIQYSQFYANVLYLNPAFAGNLHATRGIFHQRVQWPSLDAKYVTSHFSVDTYFDDVNSGVGLMVFRDVQGFNNITTLETALQYAYEIHLSRRHTLRAGIQAGYVSRDLNYAALRFPDQYNTYGYMGPQTNQPKDAERISYLDFTSGAIFYTKNYWMGASYAHMNEPNQSFYDDQSRLPYKVDLTGGYRIDIQQKDKSKITNQGKDVYLTPTVHYKTQGKSDQFDMGLYLLYDYLIAGVWYRGIPLMKTYRFGLQNNESMVVLGGVKLFEQLSISYSYDFTVSKLAGYNTGGSHEINITYIHKREKTKFVGKKMPCPDF